MACWWYGSVEFIIVPTDAVIFSTTLLSQTLVKDYKALTADNLRSSLSI